jgi:hypothetical protein
MTKMSISAATIASVLTGATTVSLLIGRCAAFEFFNVCVLMH